MNLLIVGLGNPDKKYQNNRHNVGFMFVDYLLKEYVSRSTLHATRFAYDKYTRSELAKITLHVTRYTLHAALAKPQTYMNNSGIAVKKLLSTFDVTRYTLYVVHDDLDLRLGNFKIQKGIGPKKHNGLDSIETSLKTSDFWRIRIGIDNRDSDFVGSGEGYVLSNFEKEESPVRTSVFERILPQLLLQLA